MQLIQGESASASLSSRVYTAIKRAIISGELKPGNTLTELSLAGDLGTSRTPVREALMQLENEGLVSMTPNKGATVVGITQKDIEDIYEIRSYIESLASKWAVRHITREQLDKLHEIVALQEFYVGRGDVDHVWELDTRFHGLIYEASGSNPLRHTLSSFHNYIQEARAFSMKSNDRARAAMFEHKAILAALENRDADAAWEATADHVRNAYANLQLSLQQEAGARVKEAG